MYVSNLRIRRVYVSVDHRQVDTSITDVMIFFLLPSPRSSEAAPEIIPKKIRVVEKYKSLFKRETANGTFKKLIFV
jgi:hypothetical protein